MKYPLLDIIDMTEGMVKYKGLVLASFKPVDLDETELNIFAVIDFRTTEINCSEYEAENRLERRDFVSIQNPELFGSKNALDEDLPNIIYSPLDTDMACEVPTTINVTKYVGLKEFLTSVGREDLATQDYLSNEDINKIIDFARANKEELGFGSMQR